MRINYNIDLRNTIMQSKQPERKRKQLKKAEDGNIYMTPQNLKICNINQDRYETPELNDAFELHYYGFYNIANLELYSNINTLYLNNNVISKIQNLSSLRKLITLNLANNRITKIQNLSELSQIFILDLSGNKIEKVQGLENLHKLATINISSNLLSSPKSIAELTKNKSLTCLNISNNPMPQQLELYDYLQQIPILTLFLKDTKFSRSVPSYRKQTICKVKTLTFLDERPVTHDERMMAEAWKKGGLQAEKQARKLIQQTKDQKNKKLFAQMMERSEKAQKIKQQLFNKLSKQQKEQLKHLKQRYELEKNKKPVDEFQIKLVDKKIQQLETYLKNLRLDEHTLWSAQQRKGVPNNLCQRHEADAIYIYGVSEDQLPGIKQVYYPDETRPLIAKDFQKKEEPRWCQNYDEMLRDACHEYTNKSQFIIPVFNLRVHEFDKEYSRRVRRFKQEELLHKIEKLTKVEAEHEIQIEHQAENQLNALD